MTDYLCENFLILERNLPLLFIEWCVLLSGPVLRDSFEILKIPASPTTLSRTRSTPQKHWFSQSGSVLPIIILSANGDDRNPGQITSGCTTVRDGVPRKTALAQTDILILTTQIRNRGFTVQFSSCKSYCNVGKLGAGQPGATKCCRRGFVNGSVGEITFADKCLISHKRQVKGGQYI